MTHTSSIMFPNVILDAPPVDENALDKDVQIKPAPLIHPQCTTATDNFARICIGIYAAATTGDFDSRLTKREESSRPLRDVQNQNHALRLQTTVAEVFKAFGVLFLEDAVSSNRTKARRGTAAVIRTASKSTLVAATVSLHILEKIQN